MARRRGRKRGGQAVCAAGGKGECVWKNSDEQLFGDKGIL